MHDEYDQVTKDSLDSVDSKLLGDLYSKGKGREEIN